MDVGGCDRSGLVAFASAGSRRIRGLFRPHGRDHAPIGDLPIGDAHVTFGPMAEGRALFDRAGMPAGVALGRHGRRLRSHGSADRGDRRTTSLVSIAFFRWSAE